jgi:hypothetical protein
MQPEPKKKPAPKASAQKKKKKKSSANSGKIVARVQAGSKPKPSKLVFRRFRGWLLSYVSTLASTLSNKIRVQNIIRPKKEEAPSPEPTPEPAKKSGGTWLYIFIRKYISSRTLSFCGKQTTTLLNVMTCEKRAWPQNIFWNQTILYDILSQIWRRLEITYFVLIFARPAILALPSNNLVIQWH